MAHARGFAAQAKKFERAVRRDVPETQVEWEMPLTMRKDGEAAGRAMLRAPGYKPKRFYVFAKPNGDWYTV